MAINWNRYKTYDTSKGYGSAKSWRASFERMAMGEAIEVMQHNSDGPHRILGVAVGATKAEIKAAFRRLIVEWHPDKNPHRQAEAEEMSKKILAAYTILSQ